MLPTSSPYSLTFRALARTAHARTGAPAPIARVHSCHRDEESDRLTPLRRERGAEFRRRNGRFDPTPFGPSVRAQSARVDAVGGA